MSETTTHQSTEGMGEVLTIVMATARNEALEEAARLMEEQGTTADTAYARLFEEVTWKIAARLIRDLKTKE